MVGVGDFLLIPAINRKHRVPEENRKERKGNT